MRQVLKANKITRQVEEAYPSIVSAAMSAGMRSKRMDDLCRKRNLPKGMSYYRYAEDFDPNESFEGKRNRPVVLLDTVSGERLWFGDRADCGERMGWSENRVSSSISSGSRSLLGGQYLARYAAVRP